MTNSKEHVDSFYAASVASFPKFPRLEGNIKADVCVVGGGFAGLSAAYHLREKGFSVKLLEANRISWGASGRNGGHMESLFVHHPDDVAKSIGEDRASRLWQLSNEATLLVKDLIQRHSIDCDIKPGVGFAALTPAHAEVLYKGAERFREVCGANIVTKSKAELADMLSTDAYHGGTINMDMVHLNPLQFAVGLASSTSDQGVDIYEDSRVLSYENDANKVTLHTAEGSVEAKHCVLACNANIRHIESKLASYLINFKAWMIATEPMEAEQAKSFSKEDFAINDTSVFINFFRLSGDNRLVFGAVSPIFLSGTPNIKIELKNKMLEIWPQLTNTKIDYGWECVGALTMKNLPHIGQIAPNVYFSQGSNVSWAIMNGRLLAEAIAGEREHFDLVAGIKTPRLPIGSKMRYALGNIAKASDRISLKLARV